MNEIWNEVYEERRIKVGKKKAKFSANAVVKSILIKDFLEETLADKIRKNWKENKKVIIIENIDDYNPIKIDSENIIFTTDKEFLKDFKTKRKGKIGNITDEYTREIIVKAIEKNNIKVDPSLYYVIYKDKTDGI